MLVEKKQHTQKMISTRTDDEMFYALKALSQLTGADSSTIMRLAIAVLIERARTAQPTSWEELKSIA